jgi:DNA-binding transcriptional ArsR family regulator
MGVGPDIARSAALIGDPARAAMMSLLLGGEAFPATVLAARAGISAQTASAHLAKLTAGRLIASERSGRYRLYRLADHKVAEAFEALAAISPQHQVRSMRQSDESKSLSLARMCYDHLAGRLGVSITDVLVRRGVIAVDERSYVVTRRGTAWLERFGIDVAQLRSARRKFATHCLDWSERRPHIGGALGAALADRVLDNGWCARRRANRGLNVSDAGWKALHDHFGIVRST